MVENLLFTYCGDDRVGNLFCLRLPDAEGLLEHVFADLDGPYPFQTLLGNDDLRYAGLNINAIRKFGSLEFRGMRGVYDLETLDAWATACYNLVHGAGRYAHPEHLMDEFYKSDKKEFLVQIFGPTFTDEITKSVEWKDLLDESVMAALPLAYYHDWSKWTAKMEKAQDKNKAARPMLNNHNNQQPNRIVLDDPDDVHFIQLDPNVWNVVGNPILQR